MKVHIHRGSQRFGPYAADQVRAYFSEGRLLPDDLAWHEGLAKWTPLGTVISTLPTGSQVSWPSRSRHDKRRWIAGLVVLLTLLALLVWLFLKPGSGNPFGAGGKGLAGNGAGAGGGGTTETTSPQKGQTSKASSPTASRANPTPNGALGADAQPATLVEVETSTKKPLELSPEMASAAGVTEGTIGGIAVRAARLGVVLDNSGSMTPHLSALRAEIREKFPKAAFIEVNGCRLDESFPTLDAMGQLIARQRADAIYWFCDLQDGETIRALQGLRATLLKHRVRLYVRSLDEPPSPGLRQLVKESGGAFLN